LGDGVHGPVASLYDQRFVERRGPVPQRVFKTRQVWQPQAGSVRLRGRSVSYPPQTGVKQSRGAADRATGGAFCGWDWRQSIPRLRAAIGFLPGAVEAAAAPGRRAAFGTCAASVR